MRRRYGSRQVYLERFSVRCDQLVADGWLLAEEAAELKGGVEGELTLFD